MVFALASSRKSGSCCDRVKDLGREARLRSDNPCVFRGGGGYRKSGKSGEPDCHSDAALQEVAPIGHTFD